MINLHGVVRTTINAIHPDETVLLYRSEGVQNQYGEVKTVYSEPESVVAQIQSKSDDALYYSNAVGKNDVSRNCYLFSSNATAEKPASIVRPFARTGDMLQRSDGTFWLVTSLGEDFSRAQWVNVGITMQVNPPDLTISGA